MIVTTRRRVRRSGRWARLLVTTGLMTALVGCGEPQRGSPVRTVVSSPDESAEVGSPAQPTFTVIPDVPAIAPANHASAAISRHASPSAKFEASAEDAHVQTADTIGRNMALPLELVGSGINGTDAFAVLKLGDETLVTVHRGETVGGYAIQAILPDRIELKSPDDHRELLVLGVPVHHEAMPAETVSPTTSEPSAESAFMAAGINTDQSIPEHVVFGPTARWPEGTKHIH